MKPAETPVAASKTAGSLAWTGRSRQAAFLVVVEDDAFMAKLFPENPVFFREVSYHFLLLPVHPAAMAARKKVCGFQVMGEDVSGTQAHLTRAGWNL